VKILITGATGFVGNALVRQLVDKGHGVRAMVGRSNSSRATALARMERVERVESTFDRPDRLREAMRETEAVIHLIGIIAPTRSRTYSQAHVQTTRLLLEAARQEGVRRFVHMSALGTRPEAISRYHQTKWEAEELVRRSGLDYTIFRPSIIYGPGDQFVNTLAKLIQRFPWVPVLGSGRGRMQPLGVDEVAFCFERCLEEVRSHGMTFDLGGPEALSLRQVFETIEDVLGRPRRQFRIPAGLLWPLALGCEWIMGGLLNYPPPLTRDQLAMLEESNTGDIQPAREILGLEPRSFRAGISRYLRP